MASHYDYLDTNLKHVLRDLGIKNPDSYDGMIAAEGDKCYSESDHDFIPFPHYVLIYILTKIPPYSSEVRETISGWVDPFDWIENNYKNGHQFEKILSNYPVDS